MKRATSSGSSKKRPGTQGRTNIVLDTKLIARVKRLAGVATAREAVQLALEHYARSRDYASIIALHGTGGVAAGYDPKASAPAEN